MKTLLKTILKSACGLVLLWLMIVPSGCTKKFDEFNTDETKLLRTADRDRISPPVFEGAGCVFFY